MVGAVALGQQISFSYGSDKALTGVVRYIGPLDEDSSGTEWLGIELSEPRGRHSGKKYFDCPHMCGLFVKASTAAAVSDGGFQSPTCGALFSDYEAGLEAAGMEYEAPPHRLGADDALILLDLQYDFMPGGTFGVPEGEDVIAPLISLIQASVARGTTIVASRDYHPRDHVSFRTAQPEPGPFPPHCIQGSRGARLIAPIAAALSAARKASADKVHVVFKGYHPDIDSFGAFEYTEAEAEGRLVQRAGQPSLLSQGSSSIMAWTGGCLLHCSAMDEDINAQPDVLAAHSGLALHEYLLRKNGARKTVFLAGLALDLSVCDSAIAARAAGFDDVWLVMDCCRPTHVMPVGFLTQPLELWERLRDAGIRVCRAADVCPEPYSSDKKEP